MQFKIETERETDGRWVAEIPDMPGVKAYGRTEAGARAKAHAFALRVVADGAEKVTTPPSDEKKMRKAEQIISRYRNTLRALST